MVSVETHTINSCFTHVRGTQFTRALGKIERRVFLHMASWAVARRRVHTNSLLEPSEDVPGGPVWKT